MPGEVPAGAAQTVMDDPLTMELTQIVSATAIESGEVAARTDRIRSAVLNHAPYLDAPNFTVIHPADLELLFGQYDQVFFGGEFRRSLGTAPLGFRLSGRMTSAGGKTTTLRSRRTRQVRYEITVSTAILFGGFHADDHRPLVTCGLLCRDRLDALQRIFEHELVHLAEMHLWRDSSCAQGRFQQIARRMFGHTQHKHQLITPRERAMVKFGIAPGTKVRFSFEGVQHTGIVNRISKRATVLVEDNRGVRYTNGKRYAKFYVPLHSLKVAE